MLREKKWDVKTGRPQGSPLRIEEILSLLLENRNIGDEDRELFLVPDLDVITPEFVGIDTGMLAKAIDRIKTAIEKKEQIIVFGDYDVDGITGAAILWETLHGMGANVLPYIPHRVEEGYGLSIKGIENLKGIPDQVRDDKAEVSLIITVDNGIVANEAVAFANKQGIDVLITDHHVRGDMLPEAYAVVHTTKLCGAGVAYLLSQELKSQNSKLKSEQGDYLDLVALGTVADLVPLTGANRILVAHGLKALQETKRAGLLELFDEAGIEKETIGVYEIGHVIAPRLNAMGRLLSAMDSLRLVCTKDRMRAKVLADKLGRTNRERQLLTMSMTKHAIEKVVSRQSSVANIIVLEDESYEEGIIGLIAGRIVEEFYRPAIVISRREEISKASARSVKGFNIIESIRTTTDLLVNAGGHPMAAGFSIKTENISLFIRAIENHANGVITDAMLTRVLTIDCELPVQHVTKNIYDAIQQLAPFGMGNSEPVFVSYSVPVRDIRAIGAEGKHLKMKLGTPIMIDAIAFGFGEMISKINPGDMIDIAYTIDENTWNGRTTLQMKIRDIRRGE